MMQILIQFMQDSKVDTIAWYVELWHYFISSELAKTLFFWIAIVIVLYLTKYFWRSTSYLKSSNDGYINHSDGLAEKLAIELNKQQNTCIMLKGKWGSGKTSFYKKQIQPGLKKPVFLSCLNYNDIDSLKVDIINYTKPFLKFMTPIQIVYLIFGDDFLMPKNRIIVLDDFERTIKHEKFDIDRLINVLIMLKDKYHNSLLLLCNDEEIIDGSNFIKYREKLVGKVIKLPKLELSQLDEYIKLAKKLNSQNDVKDKIRSEKINKMLVLDKVNKIYESESNIRLIIQLLQAINNMIILDCDDVKFKIRLLMGTNLIFFMYAYSSRGEEYQKLLTKLTNEESNYGTLNYDIKEVKNNLESFDYEFNNELGIDYLKLELDELLKNNAHDFKIKALDYLKKFITPARISTKNQFTPDYVLYLLFVVWTAKVDNHEELFEKILSNVEFMNQDTFKPDRDVVGNINPIFQLYDLEKYYIEFNITSKISEDILEFEKAYCLFYRNKVVNKFIESTSLVLWNEINLFADGWFIRCCNEKDQNALYIFGEDVNGVLDLYVKSNKYLNLNIIKQWLGKQVDKSILLEYYAKILTEFDIEKNKSEGGIKFFDWLLSEQSKKAPKVREKFMIIRKKFTELNKMIKDYISNDENVNKQYISLIQEYSDLIEKLDYQDNYSNDREI